MITSARMAAVDRNAAALGIPRRQLMESSGNAVAGAVREVADPGATVTIVCGRGNNGGDGFVAARFLDGYDVSVRLLGRPDAISTDIARANWEALVAAEYDVAAFRDSRTIDLPESDVLVDAIVGTGIAGGLREPAATAVRQINEAPGTVISIDVPSGLDADTGDTAGVAVAPDRVVTFHDDKPGLAALDATVTVADIGIPAAAERFVGPGDLQSFAREPESHKGDAGRVLVVGGGPFSGAPTLAALAAMRTGADLGIVACPEPVAETVQSFAPDLIVHGFPGDRLVPDRVPPLLERSSGTDCVVLGPGLGDESETIEAVAAFLRAYDGRCVVDADALLAVPDVDTDASLVCTPHQGELERMGGPREADWRDRMAAVESYAAELGHTIVVKGRYDVISDGERTRVNRTGNPGMTVGGTGDVLAGTIGTLFGNEDRHPVQAGAIGTYISGAAGDEVAGDRGYGLLASDVIDAIPGIVWGDDHE